MSIRPNPFAARVLTVALGLVCLTGGLQPVRTQPASPSAAGTLKGTGGLNHPDQRSKPYLILISFDGFRSDDLDRFDLPNFRRVLRRGARAQALIPVFPSVTFSNHYSLVTGLYPEHHGIVENRFFDPQRGASYSFRDPAHVADGSWYRGEPIWVTAESQGMVAACFFFPGSEAAIKGVRPTFWNKYDGSIPNETRVDTVIDWLRLPEDRRPHVITLYFGDMDAAAHRGRLDSPAIESAAQSLDRTLGRLLDRIETLDVRDRIYLVLTSDHGTTETSASKIVLLGSLIDSMEGIEVGFTGPVASLHVTRNADAAALRDRVNARLTHGRAYLRAELPERFHYRKDPRIGDVVIVMDEPWMIATSMVAKLRFLEPWGEHGWDPELQSMKALFVISGPGIRQEITIPEVRNVDVYPLMTELLGLRPAEPIDGREGWLGGMVKGGQ
jgi:predicted AlkP superfamily pyrophosphatase or phosphodiesterase